MKIENFLMLLVTNKPYLAGFSWPGFLTVWSRLILEIPQATNGHSLRISAVLTANLRPVRKVSRLMPHLHQQTKHDLSPTGFLSPS